MSSLLLCPYSIEMKSVHEMSSLLLCPYSIEMKSVHEMSSLLLCPYSIEIKICARNVITFIKSVLNRYENLCTKCPLTMSVLNRNKNLCTKCHHSYYVHTQYSIEIKYLHNKNYNSWFPSGSINWGSIN